MNFFWPMTSTIFFFLSGDKTRKFSKGFKFFSTRPKQDMVLKCRLKDDTELVFTLICNGRVILQ